MCEICGAKLKDDLFSFVTREPVCSICKVNYIGGLPTTSEKIKKIRDLFDLKDGEFLKTERIHRTPSRIRRDP